MHFMYKLYTSLYALLSAARHRHFTVLDLKSKKNVTKSVKLIVKNLSETGSVG